MLLAVGRRVVGVAEVVADDGSDVGVGGCEVAGGAGGDAQLDGDGAPAEAIDLAKRSARKVDDAPGPGFGSVVVDAADHGTAVVEILYEQIGASGECTGGAGERVRLRQAKGVPGAAAGHGRWSGG